MEKTWPNLHPRTPTHLPFTPTTQGDGPSQLYNIIFFPKFAVFEKITKMCSNLHVFAPFLSFFWIFMMIGLKFWENACSKMFFKPRFSYFRHCYLTSNIKNNHIWKFKNWHRLVGWPMCNKTITFEGALMKSAHSSILLTNEVWNKS